MLRKCVRILRQFAHKKLLKLDRQYRPLRTLHSSFYPVICAVSISIQYKLQTPIKCEAGRYSYDLFEGRLNQFQDSTRNINLTSTKELDIDQIHKILNEYKSKFANDNAYGDISGKIGSALNGLSSHIGTLATGIDNDDDMLIASGVLGMISSVVSACGAPGAMAGGVISIMGEIFGAVGSTTTSRTVDAIRNLLDLNTQIILQEIQISYLSDTNAKLMNAKDYIENIINELDKENVKNVSIDNIKEYIGKAEENLIEASSKIKSFLNNHNGEITKKSALLCYQFIQEYIMLSLLSFYVSCRIYSNLEKLNKNDDDTKAYYCSKIENFRDNIEVKSRFIREIGLDNNSEDTEKIRLYCIWRLLDVTKGKDSLKGLVGGLPSTHNDVPDGIEWPKMIDKKLEDRVLFFEETSTRWGKQFLSWLVFKPNDVLNDDERGNFGCSQYSFFFYDGDNKSSIFGGCADLNIEPSDNEYYCKIVGLPGGFHGYDRFKNVNLSISTKERNDGYSFAFNWHGMDWNDLIIIPITNGDGNFNRLTCMISCKGTHDQRILFLDKYGWSKVGGKVFHLRSYWDHSESNDAWVNLSNSTYRKDARYEDLNGNAKTMEEVYKVKYPITSLGNLYQETNSFTDSIADSIADFFKNIKNFFS